MYSEPDSNIYDICCKKNKVSKLQPGDIVLFGHADNGNRMFYFDTVFVCKQDGIGIRVPDQNFENQYYMASVRNSGRTEYAEGLMYKDNKKQFSFVPCKVGAWDTDEVQSFYFGIHLAEI